MKRQLMTEQDIAELEQAAKAYFEMMRKLGNYAPGCYAFAERYAKVVVENQQVLRT